MDVSLKDRTAIITGASRGIGRAIALKFGQLGASVIVNYLNNASPAAAVVSAIDNGGGRSMAVQADMGKLGDIESLFDQALERFGAVDILVNNAGLALYKPVAEVSEAEFDRLFSTNVKGVFFACQQAAKKMNDGGRIISASAPSSSARRLYCTASSVPGAPVLMTTGTRPRTWSTTMRVT